MSGGEVVRGDLCAPAGYDRWQVAYRGANVAPGWLESEAESGEIPANPFASARFRALVPEIGADFRGGWKCLQKVKFAMCRDFGRWS